MRVSGAIDVDSGFVDELDTAYASQGCAAWVQGATVPGHSYLGLDLPNPGNAGITVNGGALSTSLTISPYTGAGDYNATQSELQLRLIIAGQLQAWSSAPLGIPAGSSVTAHIAANGSGSIHVQGLQHVGAPPSTVSLEEDWICRSPP